MAEVIMYTKHMCPYCVKAKTLLKRRGVTDIIEYNLSEDPSRVAEMLEKSNGQRTVPQIFINGEHVGGSDQLHALDEAGKLAEMLAN